MDNREYTEFSEVLESKKFNQSKLKSFEEGFNECIDVAISLVGKRRNSSISLDKDEYENLKVLIKNHRFKTHGNKGEGIEKALLASLSKLKELYSRNMDTSDMVSAVDRELFKNCTHELVSMIRSLSVSMYGEVSSWRKFALWSEGNNIILEYRDIYIKIKLSDCLEIVEYKNVKNMSINRVLKVVENCITNLQVINKPISAVRGIPVYDIEKCKVYESATKGEYVVLLY